MVEPKVYSESWPQPDRPLPCSPHHSLMTELITTNKFDLRMISCRTLTIEDQLEI